MNDLLTFKTMIAPTIIQVLFWICVIVCVISGLGAIMGGEVFPGLAFLFIGPLVVRLYAEIFLVMFKINEGVQKLVDKP